MLKLDTATKQLLKDPEKRRAWIIYQLNLQGRSLAAVARLAGVNRQVLYHVFLKPYPRMEAILAEALGLTPVQLWPERYDVNGIPNRQRGRRRKSTTKTPQKQHTARRIAIDEFHEGASLAGCDSSDREQRSRERRPRPSKEGRA